ncbi:thermonuclease family protein [Mycoplasma buteonis]|uniref:thermonuclease family protein n=1 Tax=Mycoplasma buteonis TaxID=171280 RepID=UPI00055C8AE5|nr:thermonuclease family protein [Mycoplasma buteonis]
MNFKFNKKILLGLSGVIATTTPLLVAAACDNTKTNSNTTANDSTKNGTTPTVSDGSQESQVKADLKYDFNSFLRDLNVNKDDNSWKNFKLVLQKDKNPINGYHVFIANSLKKNRIDVQKSGLFSQHLSNKLNEYINANIKNALKDAVNYENTDSIFLNIEKNTIPEKFKNFKLELDVLENVNNKLTPKKLIIDFNFQNLSKNLNLGIYGYKENDAKRNFPDQKWTHEMFSEVNKIGSSARIDYFGSSSLGNVTIFTEGQYQPFRASLSLESEVSVNPTFAVADKEVQIKPETYTHIDVDWTKAKYIDGVVKSVADGDTVTLKLAPIGSDGVDPAFHNINRDVFNFKDNQITIRLAGIDTPEKAVGDNKKSVESSPFEYQFALLSTIYAQKTFPVGRKVRIFISSTSDAYKRVVGDIFYGNEDNKFDVSYSVEITKAGYTFPYAANTNAWENDLAEENSYESVVYPAIYNAFNEAIEKRNGYFKWLGSGDNLKFAESYIYDSKTNTAWTPFWSGSENNVQKALDKLKTK